MFQNSLSKTQVVLFQKALLASCVCWAGARGLGVSNWGRAGGRWKHGHPVPAAIEPSGQQLVWIRKWQAYH